VTDLLLKYSNNVVEHLGLKLYQNKPTRVIAELVANSWDADSAHVHVNLSFETEARWVAVLDDGNGMTRHELATSYLIIGRARRKNAIDRSRGGRRLMGRKGIGKLAAFGIARTVEVVTSAIQDDKPIVHWLRFDLDALLAKGDGEVSYEPELVVEGEDLETIPVEKDGTGQVAAWKELIEKKKTEKTGTLLLMSDLSIKRAISDAQLMDSLGTRFTVTVKEDFEVFVNSEIVTSQNALPEFDFRVPPSGYSVDTIEGNREVRHWVGFVKSASWPQDEAGVGVYSHGKIAQDRPFTFGVKGKEIFTRYMFGVVEADWLDDLQRDLISTDRTSINWEDTEVEALYAWGQGRVRDWMNDYSKWRQQEERAENRKLVKVVVQAGAAPKVTESEEEEIISLVSQITPEFGKDEQAKGRLVRAISDAWVQAPMRKLVKDLWASMGASGEMPPQAFTEIVERLSAHSVPESLNLAVVFSQRAFALTRLHDYVHHGSEVDLQKLIERFPWIIEPDLAVLTANQTLKVAVKKAEELGQIPTGRRSLVGGVPDKNKPDFVFLSSPEERQIVIVELKNPQEDLTIDNRAQLQDYMTWFEAHYPNADRRGYLVGRMSSKMNAALEGLKILPWTEVLNRSRARNLELLAAMLLKTGPGVAADTRLADAIELGGPEAQEFLNKLAQEHGELRELMQSFTLIAASPEQST
jgi:Histidine kinase-, DNA gyrase B-, and HSP90-like ATPase